MNVIVLLFAVGLVLLFFEVITPGAILGILGGLALLGGCVYAFVLHGAAGGAIATVVALAASGLMLYVELKLLPKTRFGRAMFLNAKIDGISQPPLAPASIVGSPCEAVTAMSPTGVVVVDGKRFEAFSRDGFVERGTELKVASVENFRLIVTKS